MGKEIGKDALLRELDGLRASGRRPEPGDIARLALNAGLEPRTALIAISDYQETRLGRSSGLTEALSVLISSLCRRKGASSVLEYTSGFLFLTAALIDTDAAQRVAVVARDVRFADALRILYPTSAVSIFDKPSSLPPSAPYTSIVCAPPIGHREASSELTDGFGSEIVHSLLPYLAEDGILIWITVRGAVFNQRNKKTRDDLAAIGMSTAAYIETAPGALLGTMMEGVVIVFQSKPSSDIFVAALREEESAPSIAAAMLKGPTRKQGPTWRWVERNNFRTFSEIEGDQLLQSLVPRGRYNMHSVGSILLSQKIEKADRNVFDSEASAFLYVPEYATSRVTATLEEQTVSAKAVYRLRIDSQKVNVQFLARIFNSPYGKLIRARSATGATIQRIPISSLLSIELPLPDRATQDRIVRIDSDVSLLHAAVQEVQSAIDHDWTALSDIEETTDSLKAILDIERRMADWWSELPYPLATIYRRYRVTTESKDRLDTLLLFFEMAAVYLAAIGTSYVRSMRSDWREAFTKWLHPSEGVGIERSSLGFWIGLAAASLKDTKRIASDDKLKGPAEEIAGPELVQQCRDVGKLSDAVAALEVVNGYRNSKAHGGHIKVSDAERLIVELQQSIRDFYEVASPIFRQIQLVRPGLAEITDVEQMKYQVDILSGSDPTFRRLQIELSRPAKTNALAFWKTGARTMCRAMPFFRLGAPQRPQETSFYVFNRIENGEFRWVSYQDAQEQVLFAPDEELSAIMELRPDNISEMDLRPRSS